MRIQRKGIYWKVFEDSRSMNNLPKSEGVYMICIRDNETKKMEVVYVGSTTCFSQRILSHEIRSFVRGIIKENESLFFLFYKQSDDRIKIERDLIKAYNPKFNLHFANSRHKNPIDKALDGRFDSWVIGKMREAGFKIGSGDFSKKKKLNSFNEKELKAIAIILKVDLIELGTTIEA